MSYSDPGQVAPAGAATAGQLEDEPLEGAETVVAEPRHLVADPAPLGLAGFAMTTFVLSLANTNIWPAAAFSTLGLAIIYGGAAQLFAGMWEFVRRNTFGAVAFTSYGAFWISYYVLVKFIFTGSSFKVLALPTATGVFLLGWAIFTFYMTVASMRTSLAVLAVFAFLTLTFALLCVGAFQSSPNWTKAGGWAGIVTAGLAWYASFGGVVNETFRKTVIPLIPLTGAGSHSPARRANP